MNYQVNEDFLLGLAFAFKIDTERFTPVKVENSVLFSLFCIDKMESLIIGRDWIVKYEILTADLDKLSKDFGIADFNFALSTMYDNIKHDAGDTIDYPDEED